MRTGSRPKGFTYLWLLFVIAIGGAGLAALGQRWQTVVQRERELEMMFRAQQIADALGAYRAQSAAIASQGAASSPRGPHQLDELLDDRRDGTARRYLRRVYADPMTGQADWVLLEDEQGTIEGLRSASNALALITRGIEGADRRKPARVSDRVFVAAAPRRAVRPSEDAASSPNGLSQAPKFNEK